MAKKQEDQNRIQKEINKTKAQGLEIDQDALDFAKEIAEETAERSKLENEILKSLQEQSLSAQIFTNLNSKYKDDLEDVTNTLKEARSIQQESLTNLKEKLGFENQMTENQKKLMSVGRQIQELQKGTTNELNSQQIATLQGAQGSLKNAVILDSIGDIMGGIGSKFKPVIAGAQKLYAMVVSIGVAGSLALAGLAVFVALAGLAIAKFKHLDELQENIRKKSGLLNSQTQELGNLLVHVNKDLQGIGVSMDDAGDIWSEFKEQFSDTFNISENMVKSVGILNKNFGVSNETGVNFLKTLMIIEGTSENTAIGLSSWAIELAKVAKVSPAKVFSDIAESTEDISIYMRGNARSAIVQATSLRQFGSTLQQTVGQAKSLLDFESSISAEMKASVFLGQSFNLQRARTLAFEGDLEGARETTLDQLQKIGGLQGKNAFQVQAILEATGMTATEINAELTLRKQLLNYNKEIRSELAEYAKLGNDITNLSEEQTEEALKQLKIQKEMQGLSTKFENTWNQIKVILAGALFPLVEDIAKRLEQMIDSGEMDEFIYNLTKAIKQIAQIVEVIIDGFMWIQNHQIGSFFTNKDEIREKSREIDKLKGLIDGTSIQGMSVDLSTDEMNAFKKQLDEAQKEITEMSREKWHQVGDRLIHQAFAWSDEKILGIKPKQNDFVMQNGNVTPFSSQDTIIGTKSPMTLDTTNVERKLDMLIETLQNKDMNTYLDGRKVDRELRRSSDRPTRRRYVNG